MKVVICWNNTIRHVGYVAYVHKQLYNVIIQMVYSESVYNVLTYYA